MNQEIIRQSSVRKIRDRYKPLFCSPEFYGENQKQFSKLMTEIVALENCAPDRFEKFILTTLILSLLRKPSGWFGGLRNYPKNDAYFPQGTNETLSIISMKHFVDLVGAKWPASLSPDLSVDEFLTAVKIKSIPEKVFWSLKFLSLNKNLFSLTQHSPTPHELLKIQAQGLRVITFEDNYLIWDSLIYEHRDVLSFWLHDLVHAAEFFQDEARKIQQIHFYRWIDLLRNEPALKATFNDFLSDEKNRTRFEYLISDMNSHPLHLIKTFRAIFDEDDSNHWIKIVKATEKLLKLSWVTDESIDTAEYLESARSSLLAVNSPDFVAYHFDAMLQFLSCINGYWARSN